MTLKKTFIPLLNMSRSATLLSKMIRFSDARDQGPTTSTPRAPVKDRTALYGRSLIKVVKRLYTILKER